MELKIEKGIPIPQRSALREDLKGLITQMEPGDSVLVANDKEANSLAQSLVYRKCKVTVRKVENGYRVWRRE